MRGKVKMSIKYCIECGATFNAVRCQLTCSSTCSISRSRKMNNKRGAKYREESKTNKKCNNCGASFVGYQDKQYCDKCRYIMTSIHNTGKTFTTECRMRMSAVRKNKTWEEIFGEDVATILKEKKRKFMLGNVPTNKGTHCSDELKKKLHDAGIRNREKHRQNTIDFLKRGGMQTKETSIERVFRVALTNKNIVYIAQKSFKYGIADFYLPKYDAYIFCDGDYWHNYPHGKDRDANQVKYLVENGHKAYRFWERDINSNVYNLIELVVSS